PETVNISSVTISKEKIIDKLLAIDINKGPGPDNLPPIFLKSCAKTLGAPLEIIFNFSLKSGTFPEFWKLTKITPIFKSDDKTNII
ncbi:hypothetical protein SGI37_20485, partial [Providencia rettgeri]